MKYIGKSKITRLRPKKNIEYPLLRLPQSHADLVGETAHIFKIDNNGKPLFVISLDEDITPALEVIQPKSDIESRLKSVEKQLSLLQKSQSIEPENSTIQDDISHSSNNIDDTKKQQKSEEKSLPAEAEDVFGGPDEIRTHDPRRVKAKPHLFSATKHDVIKLTTVWEQHNEYFKSWLGSRNISDATKRDYFNSLEKFFSNSTISKPQDFRTIQLKDKEERGLRNLLNYFEDIDVDMVAGYSLEKWRKFIKIKQSGVVEVYITDDELREAYGACAVDVKSIFKLMVFSGNRLTHIHEMLQNFDERNIIIDGEVAHYPTSPFSKGTKRTFHIFFPTSFIPELKQIGDTKAYFTLIKEFQHGRVSSKTIRKWHLNLMVAAGISESLADFIQGRAPATVGSAHYLNKVQQSREAYRKLVRSFDIILTSGPTAQLIPCPCV